MAFFSSDNSAEEVTEIPDDSVSTVKIQNNAVTNAKMADNSVGTAEIIDESVTDAKLASTFAKILHRVTTQQTVTNTTETSVFFKQIDANILSTNKFLRLTMLYDYLSNQAAGSVTVTLKIKFGATTIYQGVSGAMTTNATRRPGYITFLLLNQTDVAVQAMGGIVITNATGATTTGLGDITDDEMDGGQLGTIGGSSTESTTANKDLDVTITLSLNDANAQFRMKGAVLELL